MKSVGETETIGEIKTASKLLRDLTATVGKKTWPVLAEIESTKEIIQNAGILSFLGNKKRSAKRKASEWIARLSEKDPDERLIEELTKLIYFFFNYKNLKIAEFVEISDHNSLDLLNQLELSSNKLTTLTNGVSLNLEQLSSLILNSQTEEVISLLKKYHKDPKKSWSDVSLLLNKFLEIEDYLDKNMQTLEHGFSFIQNTETDSPDTFLSDINNLIEAKTKILELETNFDQDLLLETEIGKICELTLQIAGLPPVIQDLILNNDQDFIKTLEDIYNLFSQIKNNFEKLKKAKGLSEIESELEPTSAELTVKEF